MKSNTNVVEYERALLGAVLVDKESFDKAKGLLATEDFYDDRNKIVFQAIDDSSEQGFSIEPTPIIKLISEEGNLEKIGGPDYIDLLISDAGLSSNVLKFAEEIFEKARMRQVLLEINSLQSEIDSKNMSADEVLEQVEMNIISNQRDSSKSEFKSAKEVVKEVMEDIAKKLAGEMISGLPTEFAKLDEITGGFHKGDLIILAARPSMGKTALALNMAANIAKEKHVAFFSIEMPSKQLVNRIIGFTGNLPSKKIQKPEYMTQSDRHKFTLATEATSKLSLHLDDSPGIRLSELVWKAKRLKKNIGLDIIFIDYLQLISAGGNSDNRQAEVSAISRTLKKLARELEIPIIALSQLSRKVEQRESKVPMMSDIRESGAIEQDADLIAFVYREDYYKPKDGDEDHSKEQKTQIIIGKHRNGPTGVVNLSFNPECGLFLDGIKGFDSE